MCQLVNVENLIDESVQISQAIYVQDTLVRTVSTSLQREVKNKIRFMCTCMQFKRYQTDACRWDSPKLCVVNVLLSERCNPTWPASYGAVIGQSNLLAHQGSVACWFHVGAADNGALFNGLVNLSWSSEAVAEPQIAYVLRRPEMTAVHTNLAKIAVIGKSSRNLVF